MKRLAAMVALVACASAPVAVAPSADECGVAVDSPPNALVWYRLEDDGAPLLSTGMGVPGLVGRPQAGSRFAVVDDVGFVGIVVTSGAPVSRFSACYDAPCPNEYRARWVERRARATVGELDAIGPGGDALRSLRRLIPEPPKDGVISLVTSSEMETPRTFRSWDLTGDGVADLEILSRSCSRDRVAVEVRERHMLTRRITSGSGAAEGAPGK